MTVHAGAKIDLLIRIVEELAAISEETDLIRNLLFSALEFTGAERGFLARMNADGKLSFWDNSGCSIDSPEVSVSVIQDVLKNAKPVCLIQDASGKSMPSTASIIALDLQTIMAAPLTLNIGTNSGLTEKSVDAVLYVDSRIVSRPFDRKDLDFFTVLAEHAAAVWKNKLLTQRMENDFRLLHDEVRSRFDYHRIVGKCDAMLKVYETLELLRPTDIDVLITGETGTGKELIAKAIHYSSSRSDKAFKQINCAALPEGLVEAELFGVEKNVATEVKSRRGMIEQANGGTLFLDEIADMSLRIQNRLLHFLETRKFRKIGGRHEVEANVRILAATNKLLAEEIKNGRFRDALRYRLEIVPIHLPPLRERQDDLRLLAEFFLKEVVDRSNVSVKGFSKEAWDEMQKYTWPGNVRELKHRIQSAAILARGSLIHLQDIGIQSPSRISDFKSLADHRKDFEKATILRILDRFGTDIAAAAEELGITPAVLRRKAKSFKIDL